MSARDSPQDSHPHESLPERRKHLETRAQESRGGLVEELDFVLSHPQTTNVTKTLTIFGHRYEHVCNLLHYEVGTPEYDTFFGPLHRRVHEVLKRAVNISMLVLNNVPIDSGMALATVSLNRLQTLWIRSCNYLEGAPLPQCPSVLNFVLIIHQPGQVDSWKLLPAFPNLRFLALCGNFSEECPEALPAWEFQASFNPFRTLERLSIRDIGPDDTSSLITWLRRADELRLTHFQFQSGDIALQPDDTLQLIEVLARSPIQVLALVGTRYAEPDLIGVIAETFPGLIALTLSYRDSFRQTQDQGAIWPRPSWEYASQVGRFSKLEYFAWNLKVIPMPIAWSATFSLFQDEFPDINSHRWIKYFGYTPEEDSEEYHDDFRSIVLALSAYTPSLKLVAFTHHITQFSEISHGSDGSTNILFDRMVTQPLHIMEEYSPYDYEEWEVNVSTARVLSDVEDSTEL